MPNDRQFTFFQLLQDLYCPATDYTILEGFPNHYSFIGKDCHSPLFSCPIAVTTSSLFQTKALSLNQGLQKLVELYPSALPRTSYSPGIMRGNVYKHYETNNKRNY